MNILTRIRVPVVLFALLLLSATAAFSQAGVVRRNSNLRKSATPASPSLKILHPGTTVSLISGRRKGGYYHVRIKDGTTGWVWGKNIHVSASKATTLAETTATHEASGGFDPGCPLPFDAIEVKHPIIDDTCSIDGTKHHGGELSAGKLAENHLKNNFCVTGNPVDITYDNLLQLEAARKDVHDPELPNVAARRAELTNVITVNGHGVGEGTLVRLVIHVIEAHPADIGTGESVNCYRSSKKENDIHIALGQQTKADECSSVTAEISPHYRPDTWTSDSVNSVGEHPVRITGQLFYDSSHVTCHDGKRPSPPRASLWEIHPVYSIDVCKLTDITACRNAPASEWERLDQYPQ